MVTVSLRFEENFKKELDKMCDEMGMNLTTFFMIYAKRHCVKEEFHLKWKHTKIHFTQNQIWRRLTDLFSV